MFNCFARVWIHYVFTFSSIIFPAIILLFSPFFRKGSYNLPDAHFRWNLLYDIPEYLLPSHFFLILGYTINVDGNICNVIEIFSILFQIRCTTFRLFMTTINMLLDLSVHGMYFFYLRFVHIHNIFRFTNGRFLCCARMFGDFHAE